MNQSVQLYGPFSQILTMAGLPQSGPIKDSQLEIIHDGGIRVSNGMIIEIGNYSTIKKGSDELYEVTENAVVIPGLIDAHTHICWAGSRANDYSLRLQGISYQEIAASGGGILDTVRATRKATKNELNLLMKERVKIHVQRGVTTCEVKSGYGLSFEDEIKILEVINEVNRELPSSLIPTCLAAHTCPPEYRSTKEYLQILKEQLLPKIKQEKLCNRIDIFIEEGAFSCEESQEYLSYAKELGFTLCTHADQFHTGGSEVATKVQALSADHLEVTTEKECVLLKESKVIPIVLPGASIGLGIPFAPARMLLDHDLPLVIASDWNPGSAPQGNLLMQASLIGAYEKLSLAETLAAITSRACLALELSDRGTLEKNKRADFIIFPTNNYQDILYYQGSMLPVEIVINGKKI